MVEDEVIVANYVHGASSTEIARQYGIYEKTVIRILKRHGTKPRSRSESIKLAWMTGRKRPKENVTWKEEDVEFNRGR